MRIHPITGMTLEDGFGALEDDLQAIRLHIPYIRRTQGDASANEMLAKINATAEPPASPPTLTVVQSTAAQEPANADAGK